MRTKNNLSLYIQYADKKLSTIITRSSIRRWVQKALFYPAEITIRFVNEAEGKILNRDYRAKDYATNVLTFDYVVGNDKQSTQADIVLCTDVLEREAAQQNKNVRAHTAHLIIHGVLHAQGYDHQTAEQAQKMESIEIQVLKELRINNPYQTT